MSTAVAGTSTVLSATVSTVLGALVALEEARVVGMEGLEGPNPMTAWGRRRRSVG